MGRSLIPSTMACISVGHGRVDARALGQVAADRAVAVLVAAAPARRVRGGEVGGHAEPFAQFRVAGELGAVVVRDAGPGAAASGLPVRGAGDVAPAGPRPRLETLRPVRPVGFVLVGREPCVAFDSAADRGGVSADQAGDPPYARPVADLYPDDPPFLFRQVRIHLPQGATPLHWLSGQSPI